jgi:hypothetical protein
VAVDLGVRHLLDEGLRPGEVILDALGPLPEPVDDDALGVELAEQVPVAVVPGLEVEPVEERQVLLGLLAVGGRHRLRDLRHGPEGSQESASRQHEGLEGGHV